jgi:predicted nucleic acid-binding protein
MYLLDTNVVSELRKVRPHGAVVAWIERLPDRDLHISAVTLGEIQAGIEITREQDLAKAAEIEAWADQLATVWNVLPMDAATFRMWAKLVHRRSEALIEDAMIAATAMHHGLTIATRNVGDFRHFGVDLVNPFTTPRISR